MGRYDLCGAKGWVNVSNRIIDLTEVAAFCIDNKWTIHNLVYTQNAKWWSPHVATEHCEVLAENFGGFSIDHRRRVNEEARWIGPFMFHEEKGHVGFLFKSDKDAIMAKMLLA